MSDLLRSVRELLAYTIWADRTLLEALRGVSVEDLTRESGTSFGSLAGTMAHILAAEQRWLARFLGGPEPETLPAEAFADRLQLALAFEEIWSQLEFFIASLTAEQLAAELTWTDSAADADTAQGGLPSGQSLDLPSGAGGLAAAAARLRSAGDRSHPFHVGGLSRRLC